MKLLLYVINEVEKLQDIQMSRFIKMELILTFFSAELEFELRVLNFVVSWTDRCMPPHPVFIGRDAFPLTFCPGWP
jgi:hypothetical protein